MWFCVGLSLVTAGGGKVGWRLSVGVPGFLWKGMGVCWAGEGCCGCEEWRRVVLVPGGCCWYWTVVAVAVGVCDLRERERLASLLEEREERLLLLLWSGSSRSDLGAGLGEACIFMFMFMLWVGYLLDMSMFTVAGEGDWW
jgi:hypothetical protein